MAEAGKDENSVTENLQSYKDAAEQKLQSTKEEAVNQLDITQQSLEATAKSTEQQIGDVASDGIAFIRDSANGTQQALEEGIHVASGAIKSGAVNARLQYKRASQRAQVSDADSRQLLFQCKSDNLK